MRKIKIKYILLAVLVAIAIFALSSLGTSKDKDSKYKVTSAQWQEALGDEAHIQTIYQNVTIEIWEGTNQKPMVLATADGGFLLDNEAQGMKLVCVPLNDGYVSYVYHYEDAKWEKHDRKAEEVDKTLHTYLPGYVDSAMGGLQGEFEKATYDSNEKCYIITLQKSASSADESTMMHCKVYFEDGQLIRLETEIVSTSTHTLKLYNIGKTKVEAPAEGQSD